MVTHYIQQLIAGKWVMVGECSGDLNLLEQHRRWYPEATFRMVRATTTYEVM